MLFSSVPFGCFSSLFVSVVVAFLFCVELPVEYPSEELSDSSLLSVKALYVAVSLAHSSDDSDGSTWIVEVIMLAM